MIAAAQLDVILHGAAYAPIRDRGFLRVTGPDATRWLNGMVTNNVKDLAPGEGSYNFLLNAQGRIQGDCTIYREPAAGAPVFLLETDLWQLEVIRKILAHFIIMDDVELVSVDDLSGCLVLGQRALSVVAALGRADGSATACSSEESGAAAENLQVKETTYAGAPVWLMQAGGPLVPRWEIWSDAATSSRILAELHESSAALLSAEDLEGFRIYAGVPRYGVDIRNTETAKDLPQETGQSHALHFAKGCYLGQEIVERIRSRGQLHRSFTRFTLLGGEPSEMPALLTSSNTAGESKPAGEITSAVKIGETIYALGYARREALDLSAGLHYSGGTAIPRT